MSHGLYIIFSRYGIVKLYSPDTGSLGAVLIKTTGG